MRWYEYLGNFRWYKWFLGGSKHVLGVFGAYLIYDAWKQIPANLRHLSYWHMILGVCACVGVYAFFNVREKVKLNGQCKDGGIAK